MIAITGANGLLGNYLVDRFLQEGTDVKIIVRPEANLSLLDSITKSYSRAEGDVLDLPSLLTAFEKADTVIHAAGLVSFNPARKKQLHQVNVEGTRNVVNACLKLGVRKLVHISSVAALGRSKGAQHIDESTKWEVSSNNTDYAASKYEAELEIFRGMEEGLHVSIVNPSIILAPVQSGQSSAQIFQYVQRERMLYGEGQINIVDVRDVCEMVVRLSKGDWNGERFIASAGAQSVKLLLDGIAGRLYKRKPSVRVPSSLALIAAYLEEWRARVTGNEPLLSSQSVRILRENFVFENKKAREMLGIQFKTVDETLDWCCAQLALGRE